MDYEVVATLDLEDGRHVEWREYVVKFAQPVGDVTTGIFGLRQYDYEWCGSRREEEITSDRLQYVMPVMGVRLFYGLVKGEVVEFVLTGKPKAAHRDLLAGLRLWRSALAYKEWIVDGKALPVARTIDLTPTETTRLAFEWAVALGKKVA